MKLPINLFTLFLKLSLSLILLSLTAQNAFAESEATDLTLILNGLRTMKADFVETIYDNHGKTIQKSSGQMALDRPGKFRWQIKKPIPQLIIANQQKLWIYDPDLAQVTIRTLKKETGDAPALLLSHVNSVLEKDYAIKSLPKKMPGWKYFQLIPKRSDSTFEKIIMGFKNDQVGNMSLVDHLGHSTDIEFRNAKFNTPIPAHIFNFKPAANIDVINETRS